jgi:hypothetical protein
MSEETAVAESVAEAPATEEAPAAEEAAPPAPRTWRDELDSIPVEDLLGHKRFAGILGQRLGEAKSRWEAEAAAAAAEKAQQDAYEKLQAELLQMANDDPDAFAERYKKDSAAEKFQRQIRQQIASHGEQTVQQIGRSVGEALRATPGWEKLTPDDHATLLQAVSNLPVDQVLGVYTSKALDILAGVRAREAVDTFRKTELDKDRAATRTEMQAEALLNGARPQIGRVRGSETLSDEPDYNRNPREWDAWYRKKNKLGA